MKTNILILSEFETGGEWIATHRLVDSLKKFHPEVTALLITFGNRKVKLSPFEKQIFLERASANRPFSFIKKLFKDYKQIRKAIKKYQKSSRFDYILATNYLMALSAKSVYPYSARVIFSFHGIKSIPKTYTSKLDYRQFIVRSLEKLAIHISSAVIVPSEFAKDYVEKMLGSKGKKKIQVVPNIVPNRFFKEQNKLTLTTNNKIVLYSGRIAKYKGIENLIKAFKKIANEKNDISLVFAYPDSNKDKDIYNLIKKTQNSKKYLSLIKLLPNLNEDKLASTYQHADLLILPSELEFAPLSILEAFASGTPCIATDTGNIERLLQRIDKNLILKDNSAESIRKKIIYFFQLSMDKRVAMQKRAIKLARNYSERNAYNKLIKVLDLLG